MQPRDDDAGPRRQFATWHRDGAGLLCFGGYDGRRRASVAVYTGADWAIVRDAGDVQQRPPPLQHHRTVLWRRSLIVIGGRTRPLAPCAGLYVLDLDARTWRRLDQHDGGPEPRYRHAIALDPTAGHVLVSGGIGAGGRLLADLWLLELGDFFWRRLPSGGAVPAGRHSHTIAICAGRLLLFGGMTGPGAGRPTDAALYQYDLGLGTWSVVDARGDVPPAIYAHVAVAVRDVFMVVVGGVANAPVWSTNLFLFDARSRTWVRARDVVRERLRRARLAIGHDVVAGPGPDQVTIVGGGATCFSFGRWADAPVELALAQVFFGDPDVLKLAECI